MGDDMSYLLITDSSFTPIDSIELQPGFNRIPKNIKPDILLLTQSPKINLDRLFQYVQPKMVVADASNYKKVQKYWKATCNKQKIPFHATSEKGFYTLN